ncbi:NAD-dependent epimerase/dehydratase family protein [Rubrivivax rivuli]|nr:NAD-dependent epimerase/dehydratase family protein [Rubrivivax rivuli]
MNLLILGGTRFLGRHLAELALQAGHEVTLLHRGRSNAQLFPEAEHRIADRDDAAAFAAALGRVSEGGTWDAAIDTSAYFPRQVAQAAALLADRVGQYQLISSISVYASFDGLATDESAPRLTLPGAEQAQAVTGANYGALKALCEDAALEGFGERALIARPGLLVGPWDPTGRFTWWAERLARAATEPDTEMLAPGDPLGPVQCIDARDAALWLLHQAEACTGGACNLTGPEEPLTMAGFLAAGQAALAPQARLQWVDEDFVLAQGVAPWSDLPVWLPAVSSGVHRADIGRALATGLQCRPLAQTFADTAAWAAQHGGGPQPIAGGPPRPAVGLAPAREAALLRAWHARG